MKLTEKEVDLILRAEKAVRRGRIRVFFLIAILALAFAAFYEGLIAATDFAGLCMLAAFLSIALPQTGGPTYLELVALLTKVRMKSEAIEEDPMIKPLTEKQ